MANERIKAVGDGWYLVQTDEAQSLVAVAAERDTTWVFIEGHVARLDHSEVPASRKRSRGTDDVMAPMPATVIAINAIPGQAVTEGETLIVLEAMKMELPIKAPRTGIVKAVHCRKGELVQPGVHLLELE